MTKTLEALTITLCEQLPFNATIYEKDGLCEKPNDTCFYCRKKDSKTYLCYKKTYTPLKQIQTTQEV